MKRFIAMSILAITVIAIGSLAIMPKEKVVAKVEISSVEHAVQSALISAEFDFGYVAEATGESIIEGRPPTVIGKTNNAYVTSIFRPPIIKNKDFLPEIRRLSCASLVAASDRHI